MTYLPEESGEGSKIAAGRRNAVLEMMVKQGRISYEESDEAEDVALAFSPDQPPHDPAYEPFVEAVRREVEKEIGAEALERGGLTIYTYPKYRSPAGGRGLGVGDPE